MMAYSNLGRRGPHVADPAGAAYPEGILLVNVGRFVGLYVDMEINSYGAYMNYVTDANVLASLVAHNGLLSDSLGRPGLGAITVTQTAELQSEADQLPRLDVNFTIRPSCCVDVSCKRCNDSPDDSECASSHCCCLGRRVAMPDRATCHDGSVLASQAYAPGQLQYGCDSSAFIEQWNKETRHQLTRSPMWSQLRSEALGASFPSAAPRPAGSSARLMQLLAALGLSEVPEDVLPIDPASNTPSFHTQNLAAVFASTPALLLLMSIQSAEGSYPRPSRVRLRRRGGQQKS